MAFLVGTQDGRLSVATCVLCGFPSVPGVILVFWSLPPLVVCLPWSTGKEQLPTLLPVLPSYQGHLWRGHLGCHSAGRLLHRRTLHSVGRWANHQFIQVSCCSTIQLTEVFSVSDLRLCKSNPAFLKNSWMDFSMWKKNIHWGSIQNSVSKLTGFP